MLSLRPEDWQAIRACCKDDDAFTTVHALLQDHFLQQAARSAFLLDNLPVGVVVTDMAGRVIQVNRALLESLDLESEDVLGHLGTDFISDMSPDAAGELTRLDPADIAAEGRGFDFDLKRRDGTLVPAHVRLTAFQNAGDGGAGWLASVVDMTTFRQAEDALRHSEERYRQTVENSPNPIFSINRQGAIVSWNRACEEGFNYRRDEMIGQHYTRLLQNPDDRPAIAARVRTVFRKRKALTNVDTIFKRRDGSGRLMLSRLYPVLDESGSSVRECVFANSDVTEQKLAEERLRRSERMYQVLVESLPRTAVCLLDHNLRLLVAGGQGLADVGLSNGPLEGKTLADVLPAPSALYLETRFRAVLRGEEQHFETQFKDHIYDTHMLPVFGLSGVVLAGLLVARDVTEQRRAERAALIHEVERERLRMLTEFITSASHEFRTPLSIINLKLHLVRRLAGTVSIDKHLDDIEAQANNVLRLVESLLRMSRLDSAAEHNFFPIRLNDVLRSVIMSLEQDAEQKGVLVNFAEELTAGLPDIVADPEALHIAFYNVVENAISHTPQGGTVTLRALAEPDGALRVEISDTGTGIEAEHLPHIFDAFYRADRARTTPGLGLGLTIARKAIELHSGEISIQSAPDAGTTVTVLLPAAVPAPGAAAQT